MNGAESLVRTARAAGIELCLANPGTTELPLVAALDREPGIRAVLGLFEGVCTGAADGYARMAGRPALTLLHLGPGFANGIANLHNARRARSAVVNLIGDHATWHLPHRRAAHVGHRLAREPRLRLGSQQPHGRSPRRRLRRRRRGRLARRRVRSRR